MDISLYMLIRCDILFAYLPNLVTVAVPIACVLDSTVDLPLMKNIADLRFILFFRSGFACLPNRSNPFLQNILALSTHRHHHFLSFPDARFFFVGKKSGRGTLGSWYKKKNKIR